MKLTEKIKNMSLANKIFTGFITVGIVVIVGIWGFLAMELNNAVQEPTAQPSKVEEIEKALNSTETPKVETVANSSELKETEEEDVEGSKEFNIHSFEGTIRASHDKLNELVGWGGWNQKSQADKQAIMQEVIDRVDKVLAGGGVTDENLKQDFETAVELLKTSSANTDSGEREAIKAHRIFHDLDVVVNNNNGGGDYFNVSVYGRANL
jgi:molecular chaperone GrpE (heat shock protein)